MKGLSRRNFLVSAGSISLGSMVLGGCAGLFATSGGAAGSGTLTKMTFNGTVAMPTGADPASLLLVGPNGKTAIASGAFQLVGFQDFPSLVSIIEPASGKTILLGMLDPASTTHAIDIGNCAATLLFLALGGSQLFGDERQAFWTQVAANSSLSALTAVISDRLVADLYAFENSDPQIVQALDDAANAYAGASFARSQRSSPKANRLGDAGLKITVQESPSEGFALGNGNNAGLVIGTQTRREGIARLYNVAYNDSTGSFFEVVPELVVGNPIRLAPNSSSNLIPLKLNVDHRTEHFSVIGLSPVFDSPETFAFTDPKLEGYKATWRADLVHLYRRAAVGLAAKCYLEALGMSGVTVPSDALDTAVSNLQSLGGDANSLIQTSGEGSGLSSLIQTFAQLARSSDTVALDILASIAPIVQTSNPVLYYDLSHRNYVSEQLVAFRGKLRMLAFTGALALSLKLGPEYRDLTTGGNAAKLWADCGLDAVRLDPSGGTYQSGVNQTIHAIVDGDATGLTYAWTLGSVTNSMLDDGHGNTGFMFETDQAIVTFKPGPTSLGFAQISVIVYRGTGQDRVEVGHANSILNRQGSTDLEVYTYETPYTGGITTYLYLMAVVDKPKTAEGGNHYQGGTYVIDVLYQNTSEPSKSGTAHYVFPIAPYTGLPAANDRPEVAGSKITPTVAQKTSIWAGVDLYDLGDRLCIIKARGQYDSNTSQENKDATYAAVASDDVYTQITGVFNGTG
ncbi:MAG: hypothetical protein GC165_05225 [Armatimonadetes bacterium]|nr:hypothetical protein [Armatimonadota bacterium]